MKQINPQDNSLASKLIQDIMNNSLIEKLESKENKLFSKNELIEYLITSSEKVNYLSNKPKSIINFLIKDNLINEDNYSKFSYLFKHLGIKINKISSEFSGQSSITDVAEKTKINFEFIENNKEKLNWSWVSSTAQLDWTPEHLVRFKDYLIFSTETNFEKSGVNKMGTRHSAAISNGRSLDHFGKVAEIERYDGCISSSTTINWSNEIIEAVLDYWDWHELAKNKSIFWSYNTIQKFESKIDFKALSKKNNVEWSESLIEQYKEKWDWHELSGNKALPWTNSFIQKHQDKWRWKASWESYFLEEKYPSANISRNEGITWDSQMINQWKEKIDIWQIAQYGNITDDAILDNSEEFDRKENVDTKYCKFSDFRETEYIYRNGWQNLALNPRFNISKSSLRHYFFKTTTITYTIGNIAYDGQYVTPTLRVLEILKNCNINNLTFNDLVDGELSWSQILCNNEFINDSIWKQIIKPLFNPIFTTEYLKFIGLKII